MKTTKSRGCQTALRPPFVKRKRRKMCSIYGTSGKAFPDGSLLSSFDGLYDTGEM
ncbi:MAG: hypothetical protein LUF00_10790 [Lachnospiraceae bacterium]|nr:hypothetical protein [Lachnospiraceae bacterium]